MPPNPQSNKIYDHLEDNTQDYKLAIIFGSYARGQAYSTSDVDLLLIDPQFTDWEVYDSNYPINLNWPEEFPPLHLVCTTPTEFETRYNNNEPMATTIAEEGFAVNEDFAFTDYIRSI